MSQVEELSSISLLYVVRDAKPQDSAVHLWLQCYEGDWQPSDQVLRVSSTEVFNWMLNTKKLNPSLDSVLIFHLHIEKVRSTLVTHVNSPPAKPGKRALAVFWKKLLTTPLLVKSQMLNIKINKDTAKLHQVLPFVLEVPASMSIMMKAASLVTNPKFDVTMVHTSLIEYGPAEELRQTSEHKLHFNQFMERFYNSPELLEKLKQMKQQNNGEPQAVHFCIDWNQFEQDGSHLITILPLHRSPIWGSIDGARLDKLVLTNAHMLVFQIVFNFSVIYTTALPFEGETQPMQGHAPLTNYTLNFLERPDKLTCTACGATAKEMSRCSVCKAAHFCSPRCQQSHWPKHKPMCNKIAAYLGFLPRVVVAKA